MISCTWAMLCKKSIVNRDNNNVSLIEVLEEIDITLPPDLEKEIFWPIDFDFVVLWKKREGDKESEEKYRLVITDTSEKVLIEVESVVELAEDLKAFAIFNFNGIPISGAGSYQFQIQVPGDNKTEWQNAKVVELQVNYSQLGNEFNSKEGVVVT